jgi:hypothetical protein
VVYHYSSLWGENKTKKAVTKNKGIIKDGQKLHYDLILLVYVVIKLKL